MGSLAPAVAPPTLRAARDGALVAGVVWVVAQAAGFVGPFTDARAYWESGGGYDVAYGLPGAFAYSPAFGQLVAPLTLLPWPLFSAAWAALLLAALAWLSGRWLPLVILTPVVAFELYAGNIHVLLALAIVVASRYPAAWAFVLLTKVTPGVGLVWYVVRREWRPLALALGATVAVIAVSYALAPGAWWAWADYVTGAREATQATAIPIPLLARLPVAVALIAWGGLTDRAWTVPVGAMLALPVLWIGAPVMLLAVARPRGRGWR